MDGEAIDLAGDMLPFLVNFISSLLYLISVDRLESKKVLRARQTLMKKLHNRKEHFTRHILIEILVLFKGHELFSFDKGLVKESIDFFLVSNSV